MVSSKFSIQRSSLLRIMQSARAHHTADSLYNELKAYIPGVSLATVYRNLAVLQNEGKIVKLSVGKNKEYYDGDTSEHYHFVCSECSSVLDLELDHLAHLDELVRQKTNLQITNHTLIFYGKCSKCK